MLLLSNSVAQTNATDTTTMDNEGGLHYAPAYHYHLNPYIANCKSLTLIDTNIFGAYNDDNSLLTNNLYTNLGQYGQAHQSMNFTFNREHGFQYKVLPYEAYIRNFETWTLYSLPTVYSLLSYDFVDGRSHHFSADYGQQIKENLNFNFGLNTILTTDGLYLNQGVRDINTGFGIDYITLNRRYGVKVYYAFSMLHLEENGGIVSDSNFTNNNNNALTIDVWSTTANSKTHYNNLFLRQYLSISPSKKENKRSINLGYLIHDLNFVSTRHRFTDFQLDSNYYQQFLFNKDTTTTNTQHYQLRNSIYWANFMPEDTLPDKAYFFHFSAGINHSLNIIRDTLYYFIDNQITPFGQIHTQLFNRWNINAAAFVTINGYNAGDITIKGNTALKINKNNNHYHAISAEINFYNYSPDYFFTRYISNNYQWNNNLKKQQTIHAQFAWLYDKYNIGINYYSLYHYTALNTQLQVFQFDKPTNIYQLSAFIPLDIKGFGWHANMYLQYSDNKELQIPTFATKQTLYYGFNLFKKNMYLMLGLDFLYNTAYYANAYNPALQQFYIQSDTKIGNYGYLDVFLKAKIDRFLIQAKLTHCWAGLFGNIYYLTPHYPNKGMGFSIGLSWRFHD